MTIVKPFFFFFVVYIKYGQVKKGAKRTQHIAREREKDGGRERERRRDYHGLQQNGAEPCILPLGKKREGEKKEKRKKKSFWPIDPAASSARRAHATPPSSALGCSCWYLDQE